LNDCIFDASMFHIHETLVASSLLPNNLQLETLMKCNLVQAGQTIDSKVSFGKGGLLSSEPRRDVQTGCGASKYCVRHLGILQPIATCPIEENQYPVDHARLAMSRRERRRNQCASSHVDSSAAGKLGHAGIEARPGGKATARGAADKTAAAHLGPAAIRVKMKA
jgi:hypothetical protein